MNQTRVMSSDDAYENEVVFLKHDPRSEKDEEILARAIFKLLRALNRDHNTITVTE